MTAARTRVGNVRILALGDSYTIGESVPPSDSWPAQLAALLRDQGVGVGHLKVIAQTGWTTDELAAGIDAARPIGPFDLVTLLVGVNNQYRGRSSEQYRIEFRSLLARAVAFASGRADRVIVVSIPDWSVTPFAAERDRAAIAREIEIFNAISKHEAATSHAHYVDITPISRVAAQRNDLIASDGLHPSGAMYAEWARLVVPVALEALGRGQSPD